MEQKKSCRRHSDSDRDDDEIDEPVPKKYRRHRRKDYGEGEMAGVQDGAVGGGHGSGGCW